MKSYQLIVSHLSDPVILVEGHIDPNYKDIIINGYGIKKKQAKALRDWLTKAIRYSK